MSKVPIRILHFPGTLLYGGVGSVVMNWYRNIDRSKIQFDFCVPRIERGPLDDEIEALGGRIFSVPKMRQYGISNYINAVSNIIIQNGPFYAVHIHSIHMGAITLIAAKKAGVARRIYHSHSTKDPALDSYPFHKIIQGIFKGIIRFNATDYFACGKEAGIYIYGEKLVSNSKVSIINNGLDLQKFKPYSIEKKRKLRDSLNIRKDSLVIGNVARFVPEKNQQFIIDIVAYMKNKGIDVFAILVGDGPLKEKCEKRAKQLKVEQDVCFLGNRSDVDVLYNAMDIFILPSLFEGLPVTAIEAQACGLPCIVSDRVTSEADLNISCYCQVNLSNNLDVWENTIKDSVKHIMYDESKIRKIIQERGYDIVSLTKNLERIYLD